MNISPNATEQDLIVSDKSAEQQKDQRAIKFKFKLSKQTHNKKLAEALNPITEKLEK